MRRRNAADVEEECGGGPRGEEVQVVLTSSETAGSGGAASKHLVVFLFPPPSSSSLPHAPAPALHCPLFSLCKERSVVERGKGRGSEPHIYHDDVSVPVNDSCVSEIV